MTAHPVLAALAVAGLALTPLVGCDDDPTASHRAQAPTNAIPNSASTEASGRAESRAFAGRYCRASRAWAAHELTPFDDGDPEEARRYVGQYLDFVEESTDSAPAQIAHDVTAEAATLTAAVLPVLEKYEYSFERIEVEGRPNDQATVLGETPPDISAAQVRIQAFNAEECGSTEPPAADVTFEGPAPADYCEATIAIDRAIEGAFSDGPDPEGLRDVLSSPEMKELRATLSFSAPDEIRRDELTVAGFTTEHVIPTLERHVFDVEWLLLESTVEELAVFQYTHPEVVDAFTRVEAFDEQFCVGPAE